VVGFFEGYGAGAEPMSKSYIILSLLFNFHGFPSLAMLKLFFLANLFLSVVAFHYK
jgi:hypothetical protein